MARLALIASPFTGADAWRLVAGLLPDALAADYGGMQGPDWYAGVARRVAVQMDGAAWIAVLHSGAGGFAPALAEASSDIAGLIFADAILPHPGKSVLENAPAEFAQRLRERTADGLLAPWNTWFDEDPTPRMIPDPDVRAAFIADLPRTPFAFLEAPAPAGRIWEAVPAAYLQFSRGYEATRLKAAERGWPTLTLRSHHLAMLSEPSAVAQALSDLTGAMA